MAKFTDKIATMADMTPIVPPSDPSPVGYDPSTSSFAVTTPADLGLVTQDDLDALDVLRRHHHSQSTPQTEWIIVHNFGRYPTSLNAYASDGRQLNGTRFEIDLNTSKVRFGAATGGTAELSA